MAAGVLVIGGVADVAIATDSFTDCPCLAPPWDENLVGALDPHLTPNGPFDPGQHEMTRHGTERLNARCVWETDRHYRERDDRH